MRARLQTLNGRRSLFRATFLKLGTTSTRNQTVLLGNITRRGSIVADHVWVTGVELFLPLRLNTGDVVEFEASVADYRKRKGVDYRLSDVTGVRKVK